MKRDSTHVPSSRWLLRRRTEPIRLAPLTLPSVDVIKDGGKLSRSQAVVAPDSYMCPSGPHSGLDVVDLSGQGLLEAYKGRMAGGVETELSAEFGTPDLPELLVGSGRFISVANVEGDDAQRHQLR